MPKGWTNGNAANHTALALRAANIATKAWFFENPRATSFSLALEWDRQIKRAMNTIGGSYSKTPPFNMRALTSYTEDFAWSPTDCR